MVQTTPQLTPEQIKAVTAARDASAEYAKKEAAAFEYSAEKGDKLKDVLHFIGNAADRAKASFQSLEEGVEIYNKALQGGQGFTEKQSSAFGLLTTAAIGARNSFQSLGESTGLSTFTSQFVELSSIIESSPALKTGTAGVNLLSKALGNAGAPLSAITEAAKGGINGLANYGKEFLTSADNALKLQSAFIHLSASTGQLGALQQAAGPNFENLNKIISQQQSAITHSAQALGISAVEMEKYYLQIGKVPGALNEMVKGGNKSSGSLNMLTAATSLAIGSGRNLSEVIADLDVAFDQYGLKGENALKFTARISEVSNKFQIKLSDVQNALKATAITFTGLADAGAASNKMAEGGTAIMNEYIGALQKAGATGQGALAIINNMAAAMKGMTIEQKAFLSGQTGGPGGLMGAFKIDKMLKEGDVKGVMDKVKQQMEKQLGSIVTLEQASQSPAAAAQMAKQLAILKQGPLGGMAKTDSDAYRMLDAFKGKDTKPVEALASDVVQKKMDDGVKLQEKSYAELSNIRGLLQGMQDAANVPILGAVQDKFTAGSGRPVPEGDDKSVSDRREFLRSKMGSGRAKQEGDKGSDSGRAMFESHMDFKRTVDKYAGDIKATADDLRKKTTTPATPAHTPIKPAQHFTPHAKGPGGIGAPNSRPMPAGYQVGQAASTAAATTAKGHAMGPGGIGPQQGHNHPMTPGQPQGAVELQFTAVCDHCRRNLEVSKQSKSTSTAK